MTTTTDPTRFSAAGQWPGDIESSTLLVTGAELERQEAEDLLRQVLGAELAHWVPGASQRLLYRASAALGFQFPREQLKADHGPDPADHPLIRDWVGRSHVLMCVTCHRVFPD